MLPTQLKSVVAFGTSETVAIPASYWEKYNQHTKSAKVPQPTYESVGDSPATNKTVYSVWQWIQGFLSQLWDILMSRHDDGSID